MGTKRRAFAAVLDPIQALASTELTASGDAGCVPCQERQAAQPRVPYAIGDEPDSGDSSEAADTAKAAVRWRGPIGMEGEVTGDGRLIEKGALRWEGLPLPLRNVSADSGTHDGAVVVGLIETLERADDGAIIGEGTLDLGSPEGREAARLIANGHQNGVSMDLDDVSFEVRVAAEVIANDPFLEMLMEEDGGEGDGDGDEPEPEREEPETDEEGRVTIVKIGADDELRVTTSGRIRAATLVSIPAFANAKIKLLDELPDLTTVPDTQDPALVAAASPPMTPPAEWFSAPRFTAPTALSVSEDGRVSGHLALWGTCHITHTGRGQCVPPPHSAADYAYFHTGAVLTDSGSEVPVGHITMGTGHAGEKLTAATAMAHYENTGTVVADVTVGEDSHGIWVAGAMRPSVTEEQVRALRASPLSGDWRRIGSALELVAALAVNVPGFPVPRPKGLVASGVAQSLVAAGLVPPRRVRRPGTPGALSTDDLRYLKRLADRERAEEAERLASGRLPAAAELARRVRSSHLFMRAHRPLDNH